MTWDTREPRNQAKATSSTPKSWDGPEWWSDGNQPASKPATTVRSAGSVPSVRAATTAPVRTGTTTGPTNGNGSAAAVTDGVLAAKRTSKRRSGTRSSSRVSFAAARLVVGFALGLLGALFLAAAAVFAFSQAYDGKILPGVHAGSVDVSGLTRAEAITKIDAAYASLAQGNITITTPAGTETITYAQAGRAADAAAMADAALAIGHDGDPLSSTAAAIRTFAGGGQVPLMIKLDPMSLAKSIHQLTSASLQPATDAKVVVNGSDFTVVPSSIGRGIDEAAIQSEIINELLKPDAPGDFTVGGHFVTVNPTVSDADAQAAIDSAGKMTVDVNLTYGAKTETIAAATVKTWIKFGFRTDGTYGPVVDPAMVATYVATFGKDVNVPAVEPNVIYTSDNPTGVTTGKTGLALDVSDTAQAVEVYLDGLATGGTNTGASIAMVTQVVQPTLIGNPTLTGFVVIGQWNTTYFPGVSNGGGVNIALPAKLLNGQVVGPGQQFSFLSAVSPIDAAHGWKMGGVILHGESDFTGAIGGGICSASTTMFNAAARAGLQINERHAHFYYITRYPMGLDATVYSNSGTTWDLRWTNDTPNPIVIKSWTSGGSSTRVMHVQLWSLPDGRKVSFTKPPVNNLVKASNETQYVPSLPDGEKTYHKEYATNGFDTVVSRTVTDSTGAVIHYDTWYSHYTMVNGLLQIAGTPKPSQTPTPTPGPGTPTPTPKPAPTPTPTPATTPPPTPTPAPAATSPRRRFPRRYT
ncbi:MAG: VanW family protein [Candidatus Limnocylindrales bacterium]|jgi:vancomycin resistance protein YoaR